METFYLVLIIILSLIAAGTSTFGPKKFLIISFITTIILGMVLGFMMNGSNGILPGVFMGLILSFIGILTGLATRFWRDWGKRKYFPGVDLKKYYSSNFKENLAFYRSRIKENWKRLFPPRK